LSSDSRPHLLVIMPDTHRADCLSCAGHPNVRTPNIDRIAAEGVRFANTYSTCPICMPARSTVLSGLFCHNHGQWSNCGCLPAETDTFAKRLQAAGYHTCHIGKSHYYPHASGDHLDRHIPYMNALGWQDVQETTGPYATVHTESILTDRWRQVGCLETFREDYRRRGREGGRFGATWPSPLPAGEHMDDFVGRLAVEYIASYRRSEPLLLFVGFGGPHDPWDPPKEWAERYDAAEMPAPLPPCEPPPWLPPEAADHQRRAEPAVGDDAREPIRRVRALYFAKVSHVDHWIGRILDALTRRAMLDQTAIVYWSDHGAMLGDKGRVHKSVFYESSVKVPLIVRRPDRCGAGEISRALVSLADVSPTILDLAGCEPKAGAFGRSLAPTPAGPGAPGHDAVFSEIASLGLRRTMVRDGRFKMVLDDRSRPLKLFDLVEDPTEARNLVGRAETEPTVRRLRDRLLAWHLATPSDQGS